MLKELKIWRSEDFDFITFEPQVANFRTFITALPVLANLEEVRLFEEKIRVGLANCCGGAACSPLVTTESHPDSPDPDKPWEGFRKLIRACFDCEQPDCPLSHGGGGSHDRQPIAPLSPVLQPGAELTAAPEESLAEGQEEVYTL